jgi:hypothetical protein
MSCKTLPAATALAVLIGPIGEGLAGGKPVECYARYHRPAVHETVHERVLFLPASSRVQIEPAIYGTEKRRTLISPERVTYRIIPAEYQTIRENVLLYPATTVARKVPAVTETVHRKVKVDGGYAWEYRKIHGRMVLCKVKRKATYRTVAETVVVEPARIVHERVPASYGYRDRVVLVRGERKEAVIIPAEYGYSTERVLIQPERRTLIEVPAAYQVVSRKILVSGVVSGWQRIDVPRRCN